MPDFFVALLLPIAPLLFLRPHLLAQLLALGRARETPPPPPRASGPPPASTSPPCARARRSSADYAPRSPVHLLAPIYCPSPPPFPPPRTRTVRRGLTNLRVPKSACACLTLWRGAGSSPPKNTEEAGGARARPGGAPGLRAGAGPGSFQKNAM